MRNNRKSGRSRSRYSVTGATLSHDVATFLLRCNDTGRPVAALAVGKNTGALPPTIMGGVTSTLQQLSIVFAAARTIKYLARIANASNPVALASLFTCNGIVSDTATIDIPDILPSLRK